MKTHRAIRALVPKASAAVVLAVASSFALPLPTQAQVYDRPTYSSPIAISRNDRLIWVVNPTDDSVSVIRPDINARLAKIPVGHEPPTVLNPGQPASVRGQSGG